MRVSGTSFISSNYAGAESVSVAADAPLFSTVSNNVVQSIRAFRAAELQQEAARLDQHFLYAHCAQAQTRQQVLAAIGASFGFPRSLTRNPRGLYDCLTSLLFKAGQQRGFVIVVEQLPNTAKFDREARETLLDVFRDAADYWADRRIPCRVFYSFR
jgi:hypothetical protein